MIPLKLTGDDNTPAMTHELDGVPPKLLRELSAEAFGGYITYLRNRSNHLPIVQDELHEARKGCTRLAEELGHRLARNTGEAVAHIVLVDLQDGRQAKIIRAIDERRGHHVPPPWIVSAPVGTKLYAGDPPEATDGVET